MLKPVKYTFSVLLLLFGLTTVSSCSKENDADEKEEHEYYISFQANGKLVEFRNQPLLMAGFAEQGGYYLGGITGSGENGSNFGFVIVNDSPVTKGTYSSLTVLSGGKTGVLFAYKQKDSEVIYSSSDIITALLSTVTITELTEEFVRGTFSGKVKASDNPDISITNGEFFVKRVYDYSFLNQSDK